MSVRTAAATPPPPDASARRRLRAQGDGDLQPYYDAARQALPPGAEWFDAHTHSGADLLDGFTATPAEILASMDRADHRRALVFPFHEEGGYAAGNERVIAEAGDSGGRLTALARLDPHHDPLAEACRSLDAGARGLKLHPRAEGFTMTHPAIEPIVALAHERRLPVIIHAGRGIPALGRDTAELARRFPGARLILAHVGISDLAWIWQQARELQNLFFDTAWWSVVDLTALMALVPPSRVLYASDTPYGSGVFHGTHVLRVGSALGLDPEALRSIVGGQLQRLIAGAEPADAGPPPGTARLRRHLHAERACSYLHQAIARGFAMGNPSEPLALAWLACDVPPDDEEHELLRAVARFVEDAQRLVAEHPDEPRASLMPALSGAVLAGTPDVPVPELG